MSNNTDRLAQLDEALDTVDSIINGMLIGKDQKDYLLSLGYTMFEAAEKAVDKFPDM